MSDLDVGDEIDALEEADETDDDGPGPTFTVVRPAPAGATDVTVVDLSDVDWSTLIPAAVAAQTVADFEDLPFPAELGGLSRRALAVWARHPINTDGMTGRDGKPINADEGDSLSWELVQHIPIYPRVEYPDRPVEALRASWQAMVDGDVSPVPPPDGDVGEWWPARVVVDRRNGKCWVDIDDRLGRPISHTLITGAPMPARPEAPVDAHGALLRTVDASDPVAVVVENLRRAKAPKSANLSGRPPATATIVSTLTSRERLTCAVQLVEHHGMAQIDAAKALGCRPDSLNRSLARRRRRGLSGH